MAQQLTLDDASSTSPGRYTERRAAQFIGGASDPGTSNVIPASRSDTAAGTLGAQPPEPAQSSTRLGAFSAEEGAPKPPSATKGLLGAGAQYVGSTLGAEFGAQLGAGVGAGQAFQAITTPSVAGHLLKGGEGTAASGMLSSTLGGAAAAGIGTAIGGIISGQQPKEYLPAAGGSAVGFAIGNMILPGIGGVVGSFLGGSVFCHAMGTLIRMEDGGSRAIETLELGDRVMLGGAVVGTGKVLVEELYDYRGTIINGGHAVFEDGRWLRVKDSPLAKPIEGGAVVYPVVTKDHLLVTGYYICADLAETDVDIGADGRLAVLNANTARNRTLADIEQMLWIGGLVDAA